MENEESDLLRFGLLPALASVTLEPPAAAAEAEVADAETDGSASRFRLVAEGAASADTLAVLAVEAEVGGGFESVEAGGAAPAPAPASAVDMDGTGIRKRLCRNRDCTITNDQRTKSDQIRSDRNKKDGINKTEEMRYYRTVTTSNRDCGSSVSER